MTAHLPQHDMTYFSAPKVACSSFKRLFFRIENGREYENSLANGEERHIHRTHYPCVMFAKARALYQGSTHRIALVRDPVSRVISTFNDKVVNEGALGEGRIEKTSIWSRLTPDPDIETFIENLPKYRRASRHIDWHVSPLVDFLGNQAAFFTQLYRFDQLDEMADFIGEVTGTANSLPHANASDLPAAPRGERAKLADLSPALRERLEQWYRKDYAAFGRYF